MAHILLPEEPQGICGPHGFSARNRKAAGGKRVNAADVAEARKAGATDIEIHDAVLIAAAFCKYNRYVVGVATWQPVDEELYRQRRVPHTLYSSNER